MSIVIIIDDPYVALSDEEKCQAKRVIDEWYNSTTCPRPDANISFGSISLLSPIEESLTPYCDKMLEDAARKGL
jgi:hypothetical protein